MQLELPACLYAFKPLLGHQHRDVVEMPPTPLEHCAELNVHGVLRAAVDIRLCRAKIRRRIQYAVQIAELIGVIYSADKTFPVNYIVIGTTKFLRLA